MVNPKPNPESLTDWLRLTRTENVGPITFRQLLARFGTAKAALDALQELTIRGGSKRILTAPSLSSCEDEIAKLNKAGGQMLMLSTPDYPEALAAVEEALAAVENAPSILSVLGHSNLLHKIT